MSVKQELFSERLRALRKKLDLSQDAFMDKIGLKSRTHLSELETGIKPVQPWLERLIEKMEVEQNVGQTDIQSIHPVGEVLPRRVPVVSWARAGDMMQAGNYCDLAEYIDEWLPTDCKDENAYALIVDGDSMAPKIEAGDRVIFMPNIEAQNGDVVVARVEKTGQVFLKLFHLIGPKGETVRLTSFNKDYPDLDFPRTAFRIIHPLHSIVKRWRR